MKYSALLLSIVAVFANLSMYGQTSKLKTYTSNGWDYWEVDDGKFKTYTSEDWDYWEISGNLSNLAPVAKAAVLFIPIFTSSIYIQGETAK